MPAPLIPWQISPFPTEIQSELNRRRINRSYRYIQNAQADWTDDGNWNSYRGPMVSWVRFTSNGAGQTGRNATPQRFVMYSGKGFYQSYGFMPPSSPAGSQYQVIGYTPGVSNKGQTISPPIPHTISNTLTSKSPDGSGYPIHVPPPEVSRIEVIIMKELYRRATIEWVCFSWKQLEYLTPYFLVPRITCMVEWGWNHYNPASLVEISDTSTMRSLWDNPYPLYFNNILLSKGNYDVIYGFITNFNWEMQGNKIICTTEITSKDRLYSGIAKDYGILVQSQNEAPNTVSLKDGLFQSLKTFVDTTDVCLNLRDIVTLPPTPSLSYFSNKLSQISMVATTPSLAANTKNINNGTWREILDNPNNSLLQLPPENQNGVIVPLQIRQQQQAIRSSYIFGVFSGRPTNGYTTNEMFGAPIQGDFDYGQKDAPDIDKFWINMGLVTAILNFFSYRESGANRGNPMFEVDIQNTVIGAHPNLISCDSRVLIPNSKAPKFLYGLVGLVNNTTGDKWISFTADPKSPYSLQVLNPTSLTKVSSIQDKVLNKVCIQPANSCYRDDLDHIINYNRYRWCKTPNGEFIKSIMNNFSFPAHGMDNITLPPSPRGIAGNRMESNWSGLLSNIYISFGMLKEAIDDEDNHSYMDIYNHILQVLVSASDGFWDLDVVDSGYGCATITDKNYVGKYALQNQPVYSFDYYDADSIIKSINFRPALSDIQATRVIFGQVNNPTSKYQLVDSKDIMDYNFKDAVIGSEEQSTQGDKQSVLEAQQTADSQLKSILSKVQCINAQQDDGSLQMSLYPQIISNGATIYDYVKLVIPDVELLRMLLNDGDFGNNPRYCAVQPNIFLELTLQGIGGLRTFQCFVVRNLPEPYSDRDIIFRITNVTQTLETGNWTTVIKAQLSPLRGYIKSRLQGPYIGVQGAVNGWLPDNYGGNS